MGHRIRPYISQLLTIMSYVRFAPLYLLIGAIFASVTAQAAENDFDKVCGYFNALVKENSVDSMTNIKRNDFILNKTNSYLKPTSNARVAWEAISSADASMRYDLFQSSAESVIKSKWQCEAMKKLAPITGEF